jgi:hypothetical protein
MFAPLINNFECLYELLHITTYDNIMFPLALPYAYIDLHVTSCTCHHTTVLANNQRNWRASRSAKLMSYEDFTQMRL